MENRQKRRYLKIVNYCKDVTSLGHRLLPQFDIQISGWSDDITRLVTVSGTGVQRNLWDSCLFCLRLTGKWGGFFKCECVNFWKIWRRARISSYPGKFPWYLCRPYPLVKSLWLYNCHVVNEKMKIHWKIDSWFQVAAKKASETSLR